jgi:hypothetical protein
MKTFLLVIFILISNNVSATNMRAIDMNVGDALFILGVVDFYTNNCKSDGLTEQGKFFINSLMHFHGFYKDDQIELMNTEDFRRGFESYSSYSSCSDMKNNLINTNQWFIY